MKEAEEKINAIVDELYFDFSYDEKDLYNAIQELVNEVRLEELNSLIGLDLLGTIKRFENMNEYLNRRVGEIVSDQKDIE